jgi:hypothetical protein
VLAIETTYYEVVQEVGNHGLRCLGFGVAVDLLKHLDFFEASAGECDLDGNILSAMLVPRQLDGRPTAKAEFMDDQIEVGHDIADDDPGEGRQGDTRRCSRCLQGHDTLAEEGWSLLIDLFGLEKVGRGTALGHRKPQTGSVETVDDGRDAAC